MAPSSRSKRRLSALVLVAALPMGIAGCAETTGPPAPSTGWDTSFTAAGVPFPADSLLERSLVHAGNNFRLAEFFRKCEAGGEIRIGFIGGSITAGAQASDSGLRYATRLLYYLGRLFPRSSFRQINAGIGATNSRFGVSRVEDDLLAHAPDLMILEFAVNDDHAEPATTAETMEGLIRKCLAQSSAPALLFHTMDVNGSAVNHEVQTQAARHYGLPVVSYHAALRPMVESGQIPWNLLSPDEVHPNDTGHLICAYLLFAFLKSGLEDFRSGTDGDPGLPAPLVGDFYESAGLLRLGDSSVTIDADSGWILAPDPAGRVSLNSTGAGDRIVLSTSNREVTLLFHYTIDLHSRVEVRLDGQVMDTLDSHFPQDWGGGFLKPSRIYRDELPRRHVLELINLTGGPFALRRFLYVR